MKRAPWLATLLLGGCIDSSEICAPIERLTLPSGTVAVTSGSLVSGAEMQTIDVDEDSEVLEYRFVRDGIAYTARYEIREQLPPTDAGAMTP